MATPKSPPFVPVPNKRRRKSGKGQGESSREASAESNDETATDLDVMADDTDTASLASPRDRPAAAASLRSRESFEETHRPAAPHQHPHPHHTTHARPKRPQTLVAAAAANSSMSTLEEVPQKEAEALRAASLALNHEGGYEPGMESGMESGASTYDGDVSSAPAGHPIVKGHKVPPHMPPPSLPASAMLLGASAADKRASSLSRMSIASNDDSTDVAGAGASPGTTFSTTAAGAAMMQSATTSIGTATTETAAARTNPNHPPAPHGFLARMQADDLQARMRELIEDKAGQRTYKINTPPVDRPVRIYADGVYDLFHYGHALQLRQCKLFFPSVHLLVGVCSDELVRKYKAPPVLRSAERYESVGNCKWVDEVVEDAPWQVDEAFMKQHRIDYVAHDEEPYQSVDADDVYAFAKSQGRFLPTRRTDGVSTSELLQRIVEGYRDGEYDKKLLKLGVPELCSTHHSDTGSHKGTGGPVGKQHSSPPASGHATPGSGVGSPRPVASAGPGNGRRTSVAQQGDVEMDES